MANTDYGREGDRYGTGDYDRNRDRYRDRDDDRDDVRYRRDEGMSGGRYGRDRMSGEGMSGDRERYGREGRGGMYGGMYGGSQYQYGQSDYAQRSGRDYPSRYEHEGMRENRYSGQGYGQMGRTYGDQEYTVGSEYTGAGTGPGYGGNRYGGQSYTASSEYAGAGIGPGYGGSRYSEQYPEAMSGMPGGVIGQNRQEWRRSGPYVGKGPKGYARSDERIREDVCDRLTQDGQVDASDIEVTVANSEVTLAGSVNDRPQKRLAEDIVASVPGVRDVHNQIKVRQGILGQIADALNPNSPQQTPQQPRPQSPTVH